MKRLRTSACAVSACLVAGALLVPTTANAADASWTFSGSLTAPARSTTDVTASLSGSIDVSQGVLDSAACTDPASPPQAHIQLQNNASAAFVPLTGTGLIATAAGSSQVTGSATVPPGAYSLTMRLRCGDAGAWGSPVAPAAPVTVSIASLSSTQPFTRACRPTVPETPCTSSSQQITGAPSGFAISIGAGIRQTWSDGVVTEVAISGTQRLESAPVDTSSWTTANSTSCAASVTITASRQFRCVSASGNHQPIVVSVLSATSTVTLGTPAVTPASAMRGDTITVAASVAMTYSDGSSWPAPVDVQYRLEFMASGTDRWVQIAGPFALDSRGAISRGIAMPGAGKLRVISGTTTSSPVDLVEASATASYTWSNVSFPTTVASRGTLSATARVQQAWSDGVQRNPPDGTSVEAQFATAYSTLDTDLQWRTFTTVATSSGNVNLRTTPISSGFWRLKLGSAFTAPVFVQLTGSTPLRLTAALSPSRDAKPFSGTTSNYDISSSLSGYVGAATLELWVAIGTTNHRVGTYTSNTTISGTQAIPSPSEPGTYTPRFDLKDPTGHVLASVTGSPVTIDGYTSIVPTPTFPEKAPLVGDSVVIEVKLIATTFSGKTEELDWSGEVQLQQLKGDTWEAISTRSYAYGKTVSFSFTAEAAMQLRIFAKERNLTGPVFTPNIAAPTGTMVFGPVTSETRLVKGESTWVSARFEELYSNGEKYPVKGETAVTLQVNDNGVWRDAESFKANDGYINIYVSPVTTAQYRFLAGTQSFSTEWTIVVAAPGPLNATWSSTVRPGKDLGVTFSMRSTDGSVWNRSENIRVQFKAPGSTSWKTIRTGRIPAGSSTVVSIPSPQAGEYRAVVDSTQEVHPLNIPRPTGSYSLSNVRLATTRAQEGQQVAINATVLLGFTDGKSYPAWDYRRITLQFNPGSEGPVDKTYRFTGANVTVRTTAQVTGTYRLILPDGTASDSMLLTVVYPVLDVQWPTSVDVKRGLIVKASVKASDDRPWMGTTRMLLQHRTGSAGRWRTLSTRSVKDGAAAQLVGQNPRAGQYRVFVVGLDVEKIVTYGAS